MLNDILWPDHIQWLPPTDQTLYRTWPLSEFWVVSIEHLRRVWHADRGCLLLRTPGPVPLGLAYVLLVETNPFPNLSLFFRTTLFEYPSVLSRVCYIVSVQIQCQSSIYTLSLCRGYSWRVQLAKQETRTPRGHQVWPLVCRSPWMSTVVLYCWCHSDSALVLLYFTLVQSFCACMK